VHIRASVLFVRTSGIVLCTKGPVAALRVMVIPNRACNNLSIMFFKFL
jgi:hypothetical protein